MRVAIYALTAATIIFSIVMLMAISQYEKDIDTIAASFTAVSSVPPEPEETADVSRSVEDGSTCCGVWKAATATVFWVGEEASEDNGFVSNHVSAWDENWEDHFGGLDDPYDRCGFSPCSFEPGENPFYVALPYDDMEDESRKENAMYIPWNDPSATSTVLKNRWIEIAAGSITCFGQWKDVGPFETDDFAYVFGASETPLNKKLTTAGIDISPALRDCLDVDDVSLVRWRHVDDMYVQQGPWFDYADY